eukprot:TRINITY_DN7353_c0_g1_i1.p1 TRINITY_DN7353_c0_g1~~TRINITY_DN7353_c0_g1_i1.p1  ORF type:complete len:297 (-),score=37.99 TRINITY_DN7353_c0_g1_i1:133-1023(-)
MEVLAEYICEGKTPLFITGAGLSAPSGIAPYRGAPNAVWHKFLTQWGTRSKFVSNSKSWYNQFWLRTHHKIEYITAKPNAGHYAIAAIANCCNARVVTQNIDRLHLKTSLAPSKLVEVHGALGLYKCIQDGCPYASEASIEGINISKYRTKGTSLENGTLKIANVPICPLCKQDVLPQALLFDEDYTSHSFYQWDKVREWTESSDVIIFVGTSFSVGITEYVLRIARENNKPVFNFNLYKEDLLQNSSEGQGLKMHHVVGSADVTLPQLYSAIYNYNEAAKSPTRRRLWYYRPMAS